MFCGQCGQKIEGNLSFCPSCGARLNGAPEPIPTPAPKRDLSKLLKIGAACLAVVLLVSLVIALIPGDSGSVRVKHAIWSYYDSPNDQTCFMVDGSSVGSGVEGKVKAAGESLDGSAGIYLTNTGCLYLVTPKALTLITEDALTGAISANGASVAYATQEGSLSVYSVKDGSREQVTNEAAVNAYAGGLCISPDGKALLFTASQESEEGDSELSLYFYNRGEKTRVGKDLVPVGLSNGGKQIYYYSPEKDSLYVTDPKGNSTKLAANVDLSDTILFNSDMTQMMFRSDSKWYYSVKGGEKVRLGSLERSELMPLYADFAAVSGGWGDAISYGGAAMGLRLKTLNKQYYTNGSTLYYLQKDWTAKKIASDVSGGVKLTRDGGQIYYSNGETLYARSSKEQAERTKIAGELQDEYGYRAPWAITPDGKGCYYIDDSDTLWYHSGGDRKRVAEDVAYVAVTHDGIALFLTDYGSGVGTLYSCKNGKSKKQLYEDCGAITTFATATVLYVQNDGDDYSIYAAKKGQSFTEAATIGE